MALRETAEQIFPELAQKQRTFLIAGAVGAVLSVIGYVINQEQFFSFRYNTLNGIRDYGRGLSAIALVN